MNAELLPQVTLSCEALVKEREASPVLRTALEDTIVQMVETALPNAQNVQWENVVAHVLDVCVFYHQQKSVHYHYSRIDRPHAIDALLSLALAVWETALPAHVPQGAVLDKVLSG